MTSRADQNDKWAHYAGPGGWNGKSLRWFCPSMGNCQTICWIRTDQQMMSCSNLRSWHAWSWEWWDDWSWVPFALQHLGTCQGNYAFQYAFNIVPSVLKFSAFSHCNPGSSCVGSTFDRVWCALDEPGDKGHNQQLGGHRRQPRQVVSSTCLPTKPS
jgi:hypothetical protein